MTAWRWRFSFTTKARRTRTSTKKKGSRNAASGYGVPVQSEATAEFRRDRITCRRIPIGSIECTVTEITHFWLRSANVTLLRIEGGPSIRHQPLVVSAATKSRLEAGGPGLGRHQRLDVDGGGVGKRFEVVAAFEGGDDAGGASRFRDGADFFRHPGEVGFGQVEVRQRVSSVGVEACADQNEIRIEGFERGEDRVVPCLAELVAAGAGVEGRVEPGGGLL